MRSILRRLADRPFAAAFYGLLILSTIGTLAHLGFAADALADLVPDWLLNGLAVVYGVGALLMLWGQVRDRLDVEGAGCVLVGSGILIRLIALVAVYGFSEAVLFTAIFYIVFGAACLERFRQCIQGDRILRVSSIVELGTQFGVQPKHDDEEDA